MPLSLSSTSEPEEGELVSSEGETNPAGGGHQQPQQARPSQQHRHHHQPTYSYSSSSSSSSSLIQPSVINLSQSSARPSSVALSPSVKNRSTSPTAKPSAPLSALPSSSARPHQSPFSASSQPYAQQMTYPLPPKPSLVVPPPSSSASSSISTSTTSNAFPNPNPALSTSRPLNRSPVDRRSQWANRPNTNPNPKPKPALPPTSLGYSYHNQPHSNSDSHSNLLSQNHAQLDRRPGDRSRSSLRRNENDPRQHPGDGGHSSSSTRYHDWNHSSRFRQPDPYHYRADSVRGRNSPPRARHMDQASSKPTSGQPSTIRPAPRSSKSPRSPHPRSGFSSRKQSPESSSFRSIDRSGSPDRIPPPRALSPASPSARGSVHDRLSRPRSGSSCNLPSGPPPRSRSPSRSPHRSRYRSGTRSPSNSLRSPRSDTLDCSKIEEAKDSEESLLDVRPQVEKLKSSSTPQVSTHSDNETREDMSLGTTDSSAAASPVALGSRTPKVQLPQPSPILLPQAKSEVLLNLNDGQEQALRTESSSIFSKPALVYNSKFMYENYRSKFFSHSPSRFSEACRTLCKTQKIEACSNFEKVKKNVTERHEAQQDKDLGPKKIFAGVSSIKSYELLEKLGEGTFGEVYKGIYRGRQHARKQRVDALTGPLKGGINTIDNESSDEDSDYDDTMFGLQSDVKLGMVVALKRIIVHNELDGLPITAIREIRILKSLNHPNVVPVLDIAFSKGCRSSLRRGNTYMIFPYIDHDLAGLMENKNITFNVSQIKLYSKQLLIGTAYLHRNKILHRDLKAANLLISNAGQLMIADFGLARSIEQQHNTRKREYTNCVVTRWYRPPEILLGNRKYGTAVDMWGVGCVIGEMFKGGPILTGSSDVNQCELIFRLCGSPNADSMPGWDTLPGCEGVRSWASKPRRVKEEYERISHELADLMDKLLVLDPNKRLTAEQALDHDWFWSDPMPNDPAKLPHYDSSHEYDRRKKEEVAPKSQRQQFDSFLGLPAARPMPPKPRPVVHPSQSHQLALTSSKDLQVNGTNLLVQQSSANRPPQGILDAPLGHPRGTVPMASISHAPPPANSAYYNSYRGNTMMASENQGFGGPPGRRETSHIEAQHSGRPVLPNSQQQMPAPGISNGAGYPQLDGTLPMSVQHLGGPLHIAQTLSYPHPQTSSLPMRPIGSYNSQGVYEGPGEPSSLNMPPIGAPPIPVLAPSLQGGHPACPPHPSEHFIGAPSILPNQVPPGVLPRQHNNPYQKGPTGGPQNSRQHGLGQPYPNSRPDYNRGQASHGGFGPSHNRDRWTHGRGRERRNNNRGGAPYRNNWRDGRDTNRHWNNSGEGDNNRREGRDNNGFWVNDGEYSGRRDGRDNSGFYANNGEGDGRRNARDNDGFWGNNGPDNNRRDGGDNNGFYGNNGDYENREQHNLQY